ncbi:fatty acid desaturase-domain-containing protein [Gamsiella multidivaricata]|uniref:fatty acid desaturase-domain-containing protein n=1 Tax=Gamsiella multidivaricata TaxID=101098 RepID=UPI0022212ADE|nr:fatty acid desaturase-domain-containing protein [Gamsiella multidivaricata]KAG0364995.1 hypothetical protein BGZ54_006962 [Gamsiella multidivaricata]KAI7820519.1 fatty acid desaturase-domain-containing protein [Gamsiella multidivaricata]
MAITALDRATLPQTRPNAEDVQKNTLRDHSRPFEATETPTRVKRLALITSEDLKTPTIAIPTITVAAGSLAVWAAVLYYGAYKKKVSAILTFPAMTAACFASFTPVHDGTHSSIAKGVYKKPINNLVGYLSGIPLNIPFGVYRQLHLLHHRHTNTDKDPDVWDARGPMVLRFFKWFVPDFFWIKAVLMGEVKDAKILDAALFYLSMFWMIKKMNDKGLAFIKYWIIPQRTAYWLLTWLFAYVPHRPDGGHTYNAKDNVYKMTSVTGGILYSNGLNLAIPLLNQHLHNIHHLYPQLPFTQYGAIWSKHKDALIAAGTEIHPVYSSTQEWKWDEGLDGRRKLR